MQVYIENANVFLAWDEELECAYIRWEGFSFGEDMRAQMDKILVILKEKKGNKELVNLQKQRIISHEDREWISKNWLPRAWSAGLKYIAFVIPQSDLSKISFDKLMNESDKTRTQEAYFDNEEAARKWLREVK
jgi:hypothetical protein